MTIAATSGVALAPQEFSRTLCSTALGQGSKQDRIQAVDALADLQPPAVDELIRICREARDDDVACRAILALGHIGGELPIGELLRVLAREPRPRRVRTACRALARFRLAESAHALVRVLSTSSPLELRLALADELAKRERVDELEPHLAGLAFALVCAEDSELRARIAEVLARLWTGRQRLDAVLNSVLANSAVSGDNLDRTALATALRPVSDEDRLDMIEQLIIESTLHEERRATALLAAILSVVTGSTEAAGHALNEAAGRLKLNDAALQALRVQVGGEIALKPLLRSIQDDLERYFRQPLHELREDTERNWQQTMRSAQHAFTVRVVMSGLVFAAGLALVAASAVAIIAGRGNDAIFGAGVSLVSGLGTMLLVIYTGPLRDIRSSVTDLGSANAAFIAYVHRVSEISHTFSAKYLADQVSYHDLEVSCRLLSEAADDAIEELHDTVPRTARWPWREQIDWQPDSGEG